MSNDPSGFGSYVSPRCNGPLDSDPKCGSHRRCPDCPIEPQPTTTMERAEESA